MAKVMTKSQVVTHLAEKAGIPKKAAAGVLEELVALATKEAKASGQFVIPGLGKAVKAARKARDGPQPTNRRADQDSGQDRRKVPSGQSVQRRCCASQEEIVFYAAGRTRDPRRLPDGACHTTNPMRGRVSAPRAA